MPTLYRKERGSIACDCSFYNELNLYEDFVDGCIEINVQIFREWADKNDLFSLKNKNDIKCSKRIFNLKGIKYLY